MQTLETVKTMKLPLRTDADGVIRVGGTRIPLDTVVNAYQEGAGPEEIALRYDVLRLDDIYTVIGYYLKHRAEVAKYMKKRDAFREEVRRQIEAQSDLVGIRERLLARQRESAGRKEGK